MQNESFLFALVRKEITLRMGAGKLNMLHILVDYSEGIFMVWRFLDKFWKTVSRKRLSSFQYYPKHMKLNILEKHILTSKRFYETCALYGLVRMSSQWSIHIFSLPSLIHRFCSNSYLIGYTKRFSVFIITRKSNCILMY